MQAFGFGIDFDAVSSAAFFKSRFIYLNFSFARQNYSVAVRLRLGKRVFEFIVFAFRVGKFGDKTHKSAIAVNLFAACFAYRLVKQRFIQREVYFGCSFARVGLFAFGNDAIQPRERGDDKIFVFHFRRPLRRGTQSVDNRLNDCVIGR